MKCVGVDTACGILHPNKTTLTAVSCGSVDCGHEDTNNNRIAIEWCNTPEGAAKQLHQTSETVSPARGDQY
ncbi:hypothetical protein OESDEN_04845 [Oesophagostomum dentatum]|uniref:Uncharacterized protein n=1 Tax=Oesophagostomum dentatum TaxID=61180 RepID=A0A0B1TGK1_OESDE|nr:hypothetical protein OESDEN_04845 [Oesophagostomum dentatum]